VIDNRIPHPCVSLLRCVAGLLALTLLTGSVWAAGDAVGLRVLANAPERIVLSYEITDYTLTPVTIDGEMHHVVGLADEPQILTAHAPDLPRVCRSVAIPGDARMSVRVIDAQFEELAGIAIAPSKGSLPRTVSPKDVPFVFGEVYARDAFYPAATAQLRDPYILRSVRGAVVEFHPFQYNPVTRTLRVCRRATLEIARVGDGVVNVMPDAGRGAEISKSFHQIYRHRFVNYDANPRYTPIDEQGDMLIIAHDAWIPNVQPLAAHHSSRGISTTVVGVSTIGNNSTSIKNHIQGVYDTSDLAFVLLVGDSSQVATPSASGGSSDPSYAKLAGSDDYPDIMIGRFSAETAAQVDTQVERTIAYETAPVYDEPWFHRAIGLGSTEGPGDDGEYDDEHLDNIRTDLLGYHYTLVDQFYGYSASAGQMTTALNNGRGLINYTGHGSQTAWSSSGFSISDINALTNDNMLPFIFDVACVNGQFANGTCFAEAWLRATHNGVPTGAVAIYASSINQDWNPPMAAQDESNDLLVAEGYVSFGALCFAGSCLMMDEYASSGVNMYNTWHIFGDPALPVRLNGPFAPEAATVAVQVDRDSQVNVQLQGSDGDNDPLDYIITMLPAEGTLAEPAVGPIDTVPYTLTGRGQVVTYTPSAQYVGNDVFAYKVNDGTPPPDGGDSNVASVNVTVIAPPPSITTTVLPDATAGMDYGPVALHCIEGQPELAWSIVTDVDYLEADQGVCAFAATGTGQGWNRDDGYWDYDLPFIFPFYGENETRIRVWSNGFISFGPIDGSSYANSATLLRENRMIAPLWDDLRTDGAGRDIFIDDTVSGELTVRWQAVTYTGQHPVNFAATLLANGDIVFHYGAGNDPVTATVGVSAGDLQRHTLGAYDDVGSLTDANSMHLRQPNSLPAGMWVAPDGAVAGLTEDAGDYQPIFRVTDSLGRSDERMVDLKVGIFEPGDCDYNQDGTIDLADFAGLQGCFTGADAGPAPAGCAMFHADLDNDVDLDDYAHFATLIEE
jgi:hypothetical protein